MPLHALMHNPQPIHAELKRSKFIAPGGMMTFSGTGRLPRITPAAAETATAVLPAMNSRLPGREGLLFPLAYDAGFYGYAGLRHKDCCCHAGSS